MEITHSAVGAAKIYFLFDKIHRNIRAEGCLRSKLISMGKLDEIPDSKQGLFRYIQKLAEVSGIPQAVIEQFKAEPPALTTPAW